jgi:hypothetical protein
MRHCMYQAVPYCANKRRWYTVVFEVDELLAQYLQPLLNGRYHRAPYFFQNDRRRRQVWKVVSKGLDYIHIFTFARGSTVWCQKYLVRVAIYTSAITYSRSTR